VKSLFQLSAIILIAGLGLGLLNLYIDGRIGAFLLFVTVIAVAAITAIAALAHTRKK
jgi:uncharacterized membrane protein YjjP (DUF1212 family)